MRFVYGRQDFKTFERGEENCYLMTNGLGGFSSLTMIGSCSRNDHAVLMSCQAEEAPNHRYNMIHRLEEILTVGDQQLRLSSQDFTEREKREEGYLYLSSFVYQDYPLWRYEAEGVAIDKRIALMPGANIVGISYEIRNRSGRPVRLQVLPHLEFVPKGRTLSREQSFRFEPGRITSKGRILFFCTNGEAEELPLRLEEGLRYAYDVCDGRAETGCTAVNHSVTFRVEPGRELEGEMIYGTEPIRVSCLQIRERLTAEREAVRRKAGFGDETAGELAAAAAQFISRRASTEGLTILAGFPFFEDWGRDTMIALTGCCISTGQYETAKSILQTFLGYCREGLMPNLFPEGTQEPRYNTADAALLFILAVYEYERKTEDLEFLKKAWPVMEEIIEKYRGGTLFHIGMDEDGLIYAGEGFDQVTWMDVRIGDILPTPRHGKPVEINAYWYNALRIMEQFAGRLAPEDGKRQREYRELAERTRRSFREKFWNGEAGCLKDVLTTGTRGAATGKSEVSFDLGDGEELSGGKSEMKDKISGERSEVGRGPSGGKSEIEEDSGKGSPENQIRCNQIWAVSLPFSLLDREQEKRVVETVYRKLYTPLGLRSLAPEDPQFQPFYGGELMKRDLAYHQGTVWTFPLGGYYLAYLKVNDYKPEAVRRVREQLESVAAVLREGCIGQLPEIYDGGRPVSSKGCLAQAWSVGEILRVYDACKGVER
ncbi:MAG: amylo-alpha-1,6-glucosidase [Roseburia sp.]|nr:amylo-alpha-1,6-glucosidase [Roseburia sp.]MCM1099074.1 amylo-alpha-1,6-glucosidase [Ruminococcus flavefaciens]